MTGRECAALREIQLGHVGVEDFASGLDNEYGVTLSDLRRHLLDCATCAASMDEVRVNREAEAKHLAEKSKPEATTFRNLFLGIPSILAALSSTGRESAKDIVSE
jgi:hypothetical protein